MFDCRGQQHSFSHTGIYQIYEVVSSSVQITACGGSGGNFNEDSFTINGGNGGCITGIVPTTVGTKLYVYVGGSGSAGSNSQKVVNGGFNGGGYGNYAGGGGGASDVRSSVGDASTRFIYC